MQTLKQRVSAQRALRAHKVRAKVFGTAQRPRLAVFRSARYTEAQLINDELGKTLVRVSTKDIDKKAVGNSKIGAAQKAGGLLAEKALAAGLEKAVFDRRHYKYHGRVKAVAEGARAGGLKL